MDLVRDLGNNVLLHKRLQNTLKTQEVIKDNIENIPIYDPNGGLQLVEDFVEKIISQAILNINDLNICIIHQQTKTDCSPLQIEMAIHVESLSLNNNQNREFYKGKLS